MLGSSWPFVEEYYLFGRKVYDPATPTENVSAVGQLPIPLAFSRDRVKVLLSIDTDKTDLQDLPLTKGGDYPNRGIAPSARAGRSIPRWGTSRRAGATRSSGRT